MALTFGGPRAGFFFDDLVQQVGVLGRLVAQFTNSATGTKSIEQGGEGQQGFAPADRADGDRKQGVIRAMPAMESGGQEEVVAALAREPAAADDGRSAPPGW